MNNVGPITKPKNILWGKRGSVFPLLLFLAGVVASGAAAYFQRQSIEQIAHADFERMSVRTEAEIAFRLENVVHGLQGARGLFAANKSVDHDSFRRYVQSRDIEKEFPGIRGFGFIQRVERAKLDAFVATERADGEPDFAFRQLTDKTQTDLYIIKFIEPKAKNQGVHGLDVGSEATRRSGLRQAINTGAATVTGAITLVQDNQKTPGVLLYLPVYRPDAPLDNAVQRNAALTGVLYAPIVMGEILSGMQDVQAGLLDFEIVDAPINSSGGTVMFDADGHLAKLPQGADPGTGRRFNLRKPLQLPGRSVTLSMNSTPAFDASVNGILPWLLLGGGTLVSALLAIMLHQMSTGRQRAEALAHDMTRDLQTALRDNEALLSTLNLHSIVSVADRGGRIIEVNDAFCEISGYSREELLGQSHRIVNSGVHSKEFWTDMWDTISSGMPWRGQVCNLSKEGRLYWVDTLIAAFIGIDGKIEKYVAIRTDITESKQAQDDALQSSALLRGAIEAIDEAFVLYDPQDRLVLCNQKYRDMYAEVAHLMVPGAKFEDIVRAGAEQGQYVAAIGRVDEWVAERVAAHQLGQTALIQKLASGRTLRIIERKLSDGHIVGFRIDITELTRATETAETASLAKSQFLANMSHEIRTPMNAILGMLTLLRKTDLTVRQTDYATKSEGAARALLGLLNEILDFSKIEAGKMELDPHPFAVDQLLRDLSVILSTSVGTKPVEVLFDIDPLLPRQLVGDAMRLQQVLLNLGSNAIKFTSQGEVVLSVRVILCNDDVVTLQFNMRDSGIGIAPENVARIFSGFTQAESSTTRRFGGTGLGVVISQRFVSLMGGTLELQSELGKGSDFYFTVTLPIAEATDEHQLQRVRDHADSGSWRVLIVDDNPTAREVLGQMGRSMGWQVDLAKSGEQALQMLKESSNQDVAYQAIFVDWIMPGLDGWQTSQRIREIQAENFEVHGNHQTPVVVMVTAHGREMLSQRSAAEQALLDGFLVKPITASMLFDAMSDVNITPPYRARLNGQPVQRRLQGMRLLLVEDNLNNQQVASELLEGEGALVQIANHGKEAVEAIAASAAEKAFDVVLMDLQMPVMDGLAATKIIRNDLGLTHLPIVAMTANAMASDREACLSVGMNDHVGKPFDLNNLVLVLRRQAQWGEALPAPEASDALLSPTIGQAAQAAGVDLTAALRRLGGKQAVYGRMLQTFVKDLQAMPDQLRGFDSVSDSKRVLHTLKGLAATLGATGLSAEAAANERVMAANPSAEQCATAINNACSAIASALPGLKTLLEALELETTAPKSEFQNDSATQFDRHGFVTAIQALSQLLEAQDMEAMTSMAELQRQFGNALGRNIEQLEQAMANLDFDMALTHCNTLLEQYAE